MWRCLAYKRCVSGQNCKLKQSSEILLFNVMNTENYRMFLIFAISNVSKQVILNTISQKFLQCAFVFYDFNVKLNSRQNKKKKTPVKKNTQHLVLGFSCIAELGQGGTQLRAHCADREHADRGRVKCEQTGEQLLYFQCAITGWGQRRHLTWLLYCKRKKSGRKCSCIVCQASFTHLLCCHLTGDEGALYLIQSPPTWMTFTVVC